MKTTIDSEWNGDEVKVQGKKVVNKSTFEIGLIIEGQAKLLCAVNWGYLAASITTQSKSMGTNPSAVVASQNPKGEPKPPGRMTIRAPFQDMETYVGTPVEYGPYVEFGTISTEAQPFLRPSFDLAMGRALTVVRKEGKYYFKEYLN